MCAGVLGPVLGVKASLVYVSQSMRRFLSLHPSTTQFPSMASSMCWHSGCNGDGLVRYGNSLCET
jgi:hypothetical protein